MVTTQTVLVKKDINRDKRIVKHKKSGNTMKRKKVQKVFLTKIPTGNLVHKVVRFIL